MLGSPRKLVLGVLWLAIASMESSCIGGIVKPMVGRTHLTFDVRVMIDKVTLLVV
jgi:hypothetical protein